MKLGTSVAMKPKEPVWNSGADHSSAIHSDAFSQRHRTIKKRFSMARLISIQLMKLAVTGPSSGIVALTAMPQSLTASSIDTGTTALNRETPAALGYRMPAEWEIHEATWIAWPHNAQDWPGKFQGIQWTYVDIIRHLSKHERVHILVNDQ